MQIHSLSWNEALLVLSKDICILSAGFLQGIKQLGNTGSFITGFLQKNSEYVQENHISL